MHLLLLTLMVGILSLSATLTAYAAHGGSPPKKHTTISLGKRTPASTSYRKNLKQEEAEWFQLSHFGRHLPVPDARLKAFAQAQRLPKSRRAASASWVPLGPQPLNDTLSGGWGFISGRITAIAVNPTNSKDIWVGAADGGVWNSTDGGKTWIPMTDNQPTLAVGSIAIDPSHPNTIYIGTGEANQSQDSYWGIGVLKSTDHGATWKDYGFSEFGGLGIGKIVIDPANSQVLLLSAAFAEPPEPPNITNNRGIWRSTDAGATWQQVLSGSDKTSNGTDVVFDPANPSIVFAGLGNGADTSSGVYGSADNGVSWTQLLRSTTPGVVGRTSLGLSTDGTHVYAVIADPNGDLIGQAIYVSTDTGTNWTAKDVSGVPGMVDNDGGHQWWYDIYAAVDPTDGTGNTAYVGGVEIWQTKDGGNTWTNLTNAYKGGPVHPDQHALTFMSATSSSYYLGSDGGVWAGNAQGKFTNLNAGGLNITQFYSGSIGEKGPGAQLYGGSQDNGEDQYPVGSPSSTAEWTQVYYGDGGYTAVDYTDNAVVYEEYVHLAINKSLNGGATWVAATNGINPNEPTNFIAPFVLSPNNHNELFAGTDRIYRTTDGAGSWQPISPSLDSGVPISLIAVAPGNDNTIYAGDNKGNVFATTDGGANWAGGPVPGSTGGMVRGIAVDPTNPLLVYVSFANFASGAGQHVFMSTDGGATWTDISASLPNIPCSSILLLGKDILVGTDVGVFLSADGGSTWGFLTGLPNVAMDQIFLSPSGSKLFIATHGRGMWMFPLS